MDILGLIHCLVIHSAQIQDRDGAKILLNQLKENCPKVLQKIQKIMADSGYRGKLIAWVKEHLGKVLEIVKRTELHTFKVLPKRWIVERTFAWLNKFRRLSKDVEKSHGSRESFVFVAHIRLTVARITDNLKYNWSCPKIYAD